MSLIERLDACARFTPENYRPLMVAGKMLGRVDHAFAETLSAFDDVFDVTADAVTLADNLTDPAARTEAVAHVLERLRDDGVFPGWRGEHYPVSESFYAAPLLTVERATVPRFGTMGYGVHLNGYVMKNGSLHMWVGKRSMKKPTGPGKLDQVVAGGQPVGLSVWDNLMKECAEEAGMPADLARREDDTKGALEVLAVGLAAVARDEQHVAREGLVTIDEAADRDGLALLLLDLDDGLGVGDNRLPEALEVLAAPRGEAQPVARCHGKRGLWHWPRGARLLEGGAQPEQRQERHNFHGCGRPSR